MTIKKRPILAANSWPTNAHLIADCAKLGYLRKNWYTLDPTYGMGTWWNVFRPNFLVCHDLKLDGVDFCFLPEEDGIFDAIAFDPPFTALGGRTTSTNTEFNDRYGLKEAPRTPQQLQTLINRGMKEMSRVLKPRGMLLVKCSDYVSGGRYWMGTYKTISCALDLKFEVIAKFEYVGKPRMQPKNRVRKDGGRVTQQHPRNNLSTLLVLKGPK